METSIISTNSYLTIEQIAQCERQERESRQKAVRVRKELSEQEREEQAAKRRSTRAAATAAKELQLAKNKAIAKLLSQSVFCVIALTSKNGQFLPFEVPEDATLDDVLDTVLTDVTYRCNIRHYNLCRKKSDAFDMSAMTLEYWVLGQSYAKQINFGNLPAGRALLNLKPMISLAFKHVADIRAKHSPVSFIENTGERLALQQADTENCE